MRIERRALDRDELDHEIVWSLVGMCSVAGAAALVKTVGLPDVFCPFHVLTGLACPTCGGSRAFAALLEARIADALRLNPIVAGAVLLAPVYAVYGLGVSLSGAPRIRLVLDRRDRQRLRGALGCVVALAWAYLVADGR
jgi:hypothetical protein